MNRIEEIISRAEEELKEAFVRIDENETKRTRQILDAFRKEGVSYRHFAPSTGYGYDDIGRDTIERIYAGENLCRHIPYGSGADEAARFKRYGCTEPDAFRPDPPR